MAAQTTIAGAFRDAIVAKCRAYEVQARQLNDDLPEIEEQQVQELFDGVHHAIGITRRSGYCSSFATLLQPTDEYLTRAVIDRLLPE